MSVFRLCRRVVLLISAALLLWTPAARSAALFSSAFMSFAVPDPPKAIAAGDIDGDGHPDLAITRLSAGIVTVMLGNGDGTFRAGSDISEDSPYGIALADLDGDGDLDLAVTHYGSSTVTVFMNDGAGSFGPPTALSTGNNPRAVAIADLSGDGRPDLVVGNEGTISVLVQASDGTFLPKQDYVIVAFPISGDETRSLAIGDLNADGVLDVAATHDQSNSVSVLLGAGGGVLGASTDYAVGGHQGAVAFGDLNGDTKLDMMTANISGSGRVSIWLGNGNGTFGSRSDYVTGSSNGSRSGALSDFNGDGRLDVAVAMYDGVFFSELLGNGDGTLGARTDYGTGMSPVALIVSDFDSDGHMDIATADDASETVSIHLGNGHSGFGSYQDLTPGGNLRDVAVGRLNDDAWPDIAVAEWTTPPSKVFVTLGTTGGQFGPGSEYVTGEEPQAIAIADFNADGAGDLVTANRACCQVNVTLLLGNSDGTFQPSVDFATWPRPSAMAVGDINGDGRKDIAVVNDSATKISILIGNGNGTFQSHADYVASTVATFTVFHTIVAADLNGDGRADVIVPTYSGAVSVFLGNADGTIGPKVDYLTASEPAAVAVGDWNGDEKPDLAVSTGVGVVSILQGNGDGTFEPMTDFTAVMAGGPIAAGDFDGDGRLDLALAASEFVWIYLGDGNGNFASTLGYGTGEPAGARRIAIADVNLDGRLDVVSMGPTRVSTPSPSTIGVALLMSRLPPILAAPSDRGPQARSSVSVYPNPATLQAAIRFRLPTAGWARVEIYDVLGRRVALVTEGNLSQGAQTVSWSGRADDGRFASPGVYRVRIRTSSGAQMATFAWLPER